jgi:hypothetical protein
METRILTAQQVYATEIGSYPHISIPVGHYTVNSIIVKFVVIRKILLQAVNMSGGQIYNINTHLGSQPYVANLILRDTAHSAIGELRHIINATLSAFQIYAHGTLAVTPYPQIVVTVKKQWCYIIKANQKIGI